MKYNLTFTDLELQILDRLLQEAPYKVAAPVIDSINKQLSDQSACGDSKSGVSPSL